MVFLFCIIFGILPSLIWLGYFLKKDVHPEPKAQVIKIFLFGILIALPAALIEFCFFKIFLKFFNFSEILFLISYYFIGIAFVEEFLKYLVVREKVLKNPEFDEPVDTMLYMIIAALGFAAIENILNLVSVGKKLEEIFIISSFRFLGATFLHALSSGALGYFLALSFFETKKRFKFLFLGLAIATILHGLYDLSIMKIEEYKGFIIPIIILISLAFFVSFSFKKVKKMKSVCKIK
jgi:RsiW-degrading membrane proteinase PrsW (M82 family)